MPKDNSTLAAIRDITEIDVELAQYSAWESSVFLSQLGYFRAGNTSGHYVLLEHYSNYQCTHGWWLWKDSTTIEKECDISFLEQYVTYDMATKIVIESRLETYIAGRTWARCSIPRNNISRKPGVFTWKGTGGRRFRYGPENKVKTGESKGKLLQANLHPRFGVQPPPGTKANLNASLHINLRGWF